MSLDSIGITYALVKLAEDVGLPPRFAPLAVVLIAVLLALLALPGLADPTVDRAAVLGGLANGLAALGAYHGGSQVGGVLSGALAKAAPAPAPVQDIAKLSA